MKKIYASLTIIFLLALAGCSASDAAGTSGTVNVEAKSTWGAGFNNMSEITTNFAEMVNGVWKVIGIFEVFAILTAAFAIMYSALELGKSENPNERAVAKNNLIASLVCAGIAAAVPVLFGVIISIIFGA